MENVNSQQKKRNEKLEIGIKAESFIINSKKP